MPTQKEMMQRFMRLYREETGEEDLDMKKVARAAMKRGWQRPKPVDPVDRLAKEFAAAAREEIRHDTVTGRPYRANHAFTTVQGGQQLTFWIDIDQAPRPKMLKSLVNRREQMVGDGLQLTLDAEHWNRVNGDEEPINMPLDLTDDVEWRKNAPTEEKKAS